jgi:hypothetical protein
MLHMLLHMPRVATTLIPTKGGGLTARKRIPEDAQAAANGLQKSKVASPTSGLNEKVTDGP